jgi:hypothetical protein
MNETRHILSNTNTWIPVTAPKGHDPSWNAADIWKYSTFWVAAKERGFSAQRAEQIAEAIVNRRIYPGLLYEKSLESDISVIMGPEETT